MSFTPAFLEQIKRMEQHCRQAERRRHESERQEMENHLRQRETQIDFDDNTVTSTVAPVGIGMRNGQPINRPRMPVVQMPGINDPALYDGFVNYRDTPFIIQSLNIDRPDPNRPTQSTYTLVSVDRSSEMTIVLQGHHNMETGDLIVHREERSVRARVDGYGAGPFIDPTSDQGRNRRHLQVVEGPEDKARRLLKRMVGDTEFRHYLKNGFVTHRGESGKVYQVYPGEKFTKVWYNGTPVEQLCVVFDTRGGGFSSHPPPSDSVVMRLLILRNSEAEFKRLSVPWSKHAITAHAVEPVIKGGRILRLAKQKLITGSRPSSFRQRKKLRQAGIPPEAARRMAQDIAARSSRNMFNIISASFEGTQA